MLKADLIKNLTKSAQLKRFFRIIDLLIQKGCLDG